MVAMSTQELVGDHFQPPYLQEIMAQRQPLERNVRKRYSSGGSNEENPSPRDVKLVSSVSPPAISFPVNGSMQKTVSWKKDSGEMDTQSVHSLDSHDFGNDSMTSLVKIDKLYGRDAEIEELAQCFDRITSCKAPRKLEYVVISGGAGTGKTRLAETLRERVEAKGGFFCSGKFDQTMSDPFVPLYASFYDYVRQVMAQGGDAVKEARQNVRAAVDNDLEALIKMIPPLGILMADGKEKVISDNETNDEDELVNSCACSGSSLFAMLKLMRAICSPERPAVMMLDDVQWATACPLKKLRQMVSDDMNDGILFVGVCRNDVGQVSDVSNFLRQLETEDKVKINNISTVNLGLQTVREMVDDVFLMPEEQSNSLAEFVHSHSFGGNPYFIIESLKMLQCETKILQYDQERKTWSWDHATMDQMLQVCPCPKQFLKRKLDNIPRDIQKVLMVASCLGSSTTEHLVATALQEPVKERFGEILKRGSIVYNKSRKSYAFRNNTIHTVCYDLIEEGIRPGFHLEIGLRLWNNLSEKELDDNLFVVLSQLKKGTTLIRDQSMRYEVAALSIRAAEKAAAAFAFRTAADYLQYAFSLLGDDHWDEAYDLSLVLYNYAAEVEFNLDTDNVHVDFLLREVLDHTKEFKDTIRANSTMVYVLSVRNKSDQAITRGISVLQGLGVKLSPQCRKFNLAWGMARIARQLRGKSDQSIRRLPHMTDPNKLAAMHMLNLLFLNTYLSRRDLFPMVVLKMMKLTLSDGLSAISSVAFAGYGALLCFAGQLTRGVRFGKVGLALVEDFNAKSFESRVSSLFWGSINVHSRPWADSLDKLREGHHLGFQTGDTEFAMLNAHQHIIFMLEAGSFTIPQVLERCAELVELTELHGHSQQLGLLKPLMKSFEIFSRSDGRVTDHCEVMEQAVEEAKESGNAFACGILLVCQELFHFIEDDIEHSLETIDERLRYIPRMDGSIHESFCIFMDGISSFAAVRTSGSSLQRRKHLKRGRSSLNVLKNLAKQNPASCFPKHLLLEAENASISNKPDLANEKYEHAIAFANRYENYLDLALANKAAAVHQLNALNNRERAIDYYRAAAKAFEKLGAGAGAVSMKKKISELKEMY